MKKTIIGILAAMAMGFTAAAQPAIVRIDTVMVPYIQFDYQSWVDSDPHHPLRQIRARLPYISDTTMGTYFTGDMVQYNYIEGGTDVYGIAVWAGPGGPSGPDVPFFPAEKLYLYDATPDSIVLLEQVLFDNLAPSSNYDQYLWPKATDDRLLPSDSIIDCNHLYHNQQPCAGIRRWDFYFDKPVHVGDSFYVGASDNYAVGWLMALANMAERQRYGTAEPLPPRLSPVYLAQVTSNCLAGLYDSTCMAPLMKVKQRWDFPDFPRYGTDFSGREIIPGSGYIDKQWVTKYTPDFWMIVPIIAALDTLTTDDLPQCTEVSWFIVREVTDRAAVLQWQAPDNHTEWQISYGPKGITPEEGTKVYCPEVRWVCTDTTLQGDTMVAWVRTVCRDEDYLRYSEWSHPLEWCMGNCSNEGIALPEGSAVVDGMVQLSPNPASGEVTVRSNYLLKGLEVYTQRGELYRTLDASGLQSAFSVQGWPQGSYIVAVHTAAGTTAKKLVVQP